MSVVMITPRAGSGSGAQFERVAADRVGGMLSDQGEFSAHDELSAFNPTNLLSVAIGRSGAVGRPGRVLIASDESSITHVRALIAHIQSFQSRTERTRGQIFIEVESASDIELIEVPELMTVTWLVRSARTGAPGTSEPCHVGLALDRAVRAWVSEMSTGDVELDGGEITAVVFGADAPASVLSDLRLDLISRLGVVSAA